MKKITIIGYGEAGRIYAADLAGKGVAVSVWDKKFPTPEGAALITLADSSGLRVAASLADALTGAEIILSLVTAANALPVAEQAAPLLQSGQCFLDFNSVAPQTKRDAERAIRGGAGEYVDVAVMAPVPPKRLATPLLLGGERAAATAESLAALGCSATAGSQRVGDVSAIKMCRSVMIKGLEALTTECMTAARQYGVEDAVIASLHASFPSLGWNDALPDYLISRVAEHGTRRAEEMAEVVKTLQDIGLRAEMSQSTRLVQAALPVRLDKHQLRYAELTPFSWRKVVDKIYSR